MLIYLLKYLFYYTYLYVNLFIKQRRYKGLSLCDGCPCAYAVIKMQYICNTYNAKKDVDKRIKMNYYVINVSRGTHEKHIIKRKEVLLWKKNQ